MQFNLHLLIFEFTYHITQNVQMKQSKTNYYHLSMKAYPGIVLEKIDA